MKATRTVSILMIIFVALCVLGARTIQLGSAAVAGYHLTFGRGLDPVDVSGGENHADVYLADGTWTITATAYRLNGEVGIEADAVASGSISITVSGGEDSEDGQENQYSKKNRENRMKRWKKEQQNILWK